MFNNKDFTSSSKDNKETDNTRMNIQNCDHHTCCVACHRMHKALLEKMDILINLISRQEKEKLLLTTTTISEFENKILPKFPLSTVEDFRKFEKNLKTYEDLQILFKENIAIIGGKNSEQNIRNILKYVFTDDLCCQMSWTGQKGSIPIKDTKTCFIITDYATTVKLLDIYTTQKIIGEWMRHAGDRIRYKLKTEKEKANKQ